MKILTRYILKEMFGPTVLGFIFYTSLILLRNLFDMAGMIIRRSLSAGAVGKLLLWSLPHVVVLTVPMSLLFGILIAIGRLSSDSEIIAIRALGISTRTIYRPVFVFSFLVFLLNAWLMNDVLPAGNARLSSIKAELFTSSVEKEIKPRVFYDEFENLILYVNDLDPRTGQWNGVFVADNRSDEAAQSQTPAQMAESVAASQSSRDNAMSALNARGQRIIVADRGNLSIYKKTKQIWMNLHSAQTHIWDPRKPANYDYNNNREQRILLPDKFSTELAPVPNQLARSFREMSLKELLNQEAALKHTKDTYSYNIARVEIHKKFSIPFACLVFGIVGLPLGITNRRGGKSSGFSLSIAIILFYYVALNNGEHLAASGKIPPAVGMWGANVILLIFGIWLLSRANRDTGAQRPSGGIVARVWSALTGWLPRRRAAATAPSGVGAAAAETPVDDEPVLRGLDITFPNIIDRYVLREFLKVLGLVMLSVVALFMIVDYTDIAGDVREHNIPFHIIFSYYKVLMFQVLHWTLPISVLVATLVTFGILSKNNEITAIKSGGVSLFRVAVPVIAVSALIAVFAYLNLDFVLPYSQQRVDKLKRRIEGKPAITASTQKLWFLGKGGRYIINFLSYDKNAKVLSQVQVFEFHPEQFHLTRRVYAQRATWNGNGWVFENGWIRSFTDDGKATFTQITQPTALYYKETPDDFGAELKSADQMTFAQLRRYVETIRRSGYSAEELSVKLYTKTSWPAISVVMALIALPFAFKMGRRGALYGIGIALVLGIAYWLIFEIFTKFGEVGNLPPLLSAWSANILFGIGALYLFSHVET